jgi:hypothetical protein
MLVARATGGDAAQADPRSKGEATVTGKLVAMYDKGKAAGRRTETNATDEQRRLAAVTRCGSSSFIRGEGGWGWRRGRPGRRTSAGACARPSGDVPDVADQAFVYRPQRRPQPAPHRPVVRRDGGFDRRSCHGLCSYGFTGRALLQTFCGRRLVAFQHIEARFASPVLPGEALTISMWDLGGGEAVFTTSVGDRVVIDQGLHRYR